MRIILAVTMLTIFFGCKEKPPLIDKCSNGFVDAGENGVDCGGNCPPCPIFSPPSLYLEMNGTPLTMPNNSITISAGNFILSTSNDSLVFKFNLGNDLGIGSSTLNYSGTYCQKNGVYYLNSTNGSKAIASNDSVQKTISGFLQTDFTRTGFTDTIKIRNCQFDYITYP